MKTYIHQTPLLRRDLARKPIAELQAELDALLRHGNDIMGRDDWDYNDLHVMDEGLMTELTDHDLAIRLTTELADYISTLSKTDARPTRKELNKRLRVAASWGRVNDCEVLLTHGANVAADDKGWTALQNAIINGHVLVCDLLLSHGADLTSPGIGGFTPFQLAVSYGECAVVDYFVQTHGEDLDQIAVSGETLEEIAQRRDDNVQMMTFLMARRSAAVGAAVDAALHSTTISAPVSPKATRRSAVSTMSL
jgi:hypothetical protein